MRLVRVVMPAKKTYDEVKEIFQNANCRLYSTEYVNVHAPLQYYCHCGSEQLATTTLDRFRKHGIAKCHQCPGHREFPKKLKYEDVAKIFSDKGCTLISEKYISNKKNLQYKCSCGSEQICEIVLWTFQLHGTNCSQCRDSRIRATNQERFGVDYVAQRDGPVKERQMAGITKYVEEKKHKYEDVKAEFESKGLRLLETEYVSVTEPMKYECTVCGNSSSIKYEKLHNSGQSCNSNECVMKKIMATNLERWGYLSSSSSPIIKEKVKNTNEEKYGMWYSQTDSFKERYKKTCMDRYGIDHPFKTDNIKKKIRKNCMDKYGVEFYSQVDKIKMKIISTNMKRYGVPCIFQNETIKEKIKKTNIDKYGFPCVLQNPTIHAKAIESLYKIYGVDNVSKVSDIQDQKMVTSYINHGTPYPMQNEKISEKSMKNAFKLKSYIFPSGKNIVLQGYEDKAIDILLKYFDEDEIITERAAVPEIWYTLNSGYYRRYFTDIYIPSKNFIIEVKSTYTFLLDLSKLKYKIKACKYSGYKFILLVFDGINIINHDDLSCIIYN